MVSLSLDYLLKRPKAFVEQKRLPWTHVWIGKWSPENAVTKSYGIGKVPSYWLIGADGRIIAKNLTIQQLKSAVQKALAK